MFCGRACCRAGGRKGVTSPGQVPRVDQLCRISFLQTYDCQQQLKLLFLVCIRAWYGVVLLRVAKERKQMEIRWGGWTKMRNSQYALYDGCFRRVEWSGVWL